MVRSPPQLLAFSYAVRGTPDRVAVAPYNSNGHAARLWRTYTRDMKRLEGCLGRRELQIVVLVLSSDAGRTREAEV